MKLRPSRILKELRAGQCPATIKMNLADPRIVELCGLAGASAVWLCNEHVSNDWFNIENQVRAAKLYDMDSIVRVEKGSYSELAHWASLLDGESYWLILSEVPAFESAAA